MLMCRVSLLIPVFLVVQAHVDSNVEAPTRKSSAVPRRLFGSRPLRPLRALASGYAKAMKERPLLTNVATGATLACLSDAICQTNLEKRPNLDLTRLRALTTWGGFYDGGLNHFIVESYVRTILPQWFRQCKIRQGIGCTVLDNFIVSPFIYIPAYHILTRLLQGEKFDAAFQKMKDKWRPSVEECLKIWVPFQALNFGLVPQHYRCAVVNMGNVVWNIIFDQLAHGEAPAVAEKEAVPIPASFSAEAAGVAQVADRAMLAHTELATPRVESTAAVAAAAVAAAVVASASTPLALNTGPVHTESSLGRRIPQAEVRRPAIRSTRPFLAAPQQAKLRPRASPTTALLAESSSQADFIALLAVVLTGLILGTGVTLARLKSTS
eukprot:gnl/MRDRNA2_/MRDRNA2_78590_c1_seq1.p1 gnl/MRDRNA2_/MRDRNA2_78590_c1~~gnl/MRDRNA2_/MRDRNA2_78590_c1_seq1.p1  ORF type:complete len:381 (+),score=53.34 gnl/MRDRNA2_/MRDRNA2_78590_c1_seq1:269-1411(+)